MVVGTSCVAVPMVLNGAIGAKLHIPFSVVVRSGFGYYFGYFCIISRSILAMFWLGIQGANGAQCITIMLAVSHRTLHSVRAHTNENYRLSGLLITESTTRYLQTRASQRTA